MALRRQDVEDQQNFLAFLQRVDLAEAWIREMVSPSWAGTELGVGELQACSSLTGTPAGNSQSCIPPRHYPNSWVLRGSRHWSLVLSVLLSRPSTGYGGERL